MKMTRIGLIFVLFLVIVTTIIGGIQKINDQHKEKVGLSSIVRSALQLEPKKQKEELVELTQDFNAMEEALIVELNKATSNEQKSAVVYLMGFYRSETCVRELARHVAMKYESGEPVGKLPLWGKYPAVEALTRVGKPANWHMLRNIETGTDIEFRRLSTEVILKSEGPEVARLIIELEMKKAKQEIARKRLQEALTYANDLKR